MISPRELYRKSHPKEVELLAVLVHESWFERAVTYAYASLACKGASLERQEGAELLLTELKGLAEEEPTAPELPDKSALASYDHPGQLPEEKKKD